MTKLWPRFLVGLIDAVFPDERFDSGRLQNEFDWIHWREQEPIRTYFLIKVSTKLIENKGFVHESLGVQHRSY